MISVYYWSNGKTDSYHRSKELRYQLQPTLWEIVHFGGTATDKPGRSIEPVSAESARLFLAAKSKDCNEAKKALSKHFG